MRRVMFVRRGIGRLVGLCVAALVVAAPALAQPPAMAAVGVIDLRERGACTGVLIEPDLVLTAGHCLAGKINGRRFAPEQLSFRTGAYPGHVSHSVAGRDFAIHPFYLDGSGSRFERLRHDAALLRLQSPVPPEVALPLPVVEGEGRLDASPIVASYRGGAAERARERRCAVLDRAPSLMRLVCKVRKGESGSPVIVDGPEGLGVYGVVSATSKVKRTEVALAAEAAPLVGPLRALVAGRRPIHPSVRP